MKASKGNKEYTITEAQKKSYLEAGYDVSDDEGNIIDYGRGKSVSASEHERVLKELEESKAKGGKGEDNQEAIGILTVYAKEHGIDIGSAKSISGIVKKIKENKPEGGE